MAEHPRRPIVTYETCREAERAVDHVSPGVFVQRVASIGHDVRRVEHVIGCMDNGRAAWHGAASGAFRCADQLALRPRRPGGTYCSAPSPARFSERT
ncbi:general stress protein [Streptomyces sp. NPDC005722]